MTETELSTHKLLLALVNQIWSVFRKAFRYNSRLVTALQVNLKICFFNLVLKKKMLEFRVLTSMPRVLIHTQTKNNHSSLDSTFESKIKM